jgi:hypothetical protein
MESSDRSRVLARSYPALHNEREGCLRPDESSRVVDRKNLARLEVFQ